ncbi:class I SAM-dependent methyltransferase [Streptomyces vilmorinianum]|uniref:class I SAM-dependent methyltransferase n=1 Tax=Streptomyces vilmorinianum TaxID=3051092 RepID=UPI0010FB392D|nr:class I SAM-dependent methyltransferase [Streptomyces vilmorinianum]
MARKVTADPARLWVDRWERQQELYATAREERFHVVGDVVAHSTRGTRRPVVADLGCGPGSLAARLAARLPHARVLAVDHDPLLLALGSAVHGEAVRFVDAPIGAGPWAAALSAVGPLDAVVSTTALHYLPVDVLATVYEEVHELLRPGGVLVNADHLFPEDDEIGRLAAAVASGHDARRGSRPPEDWRGWWAGLAADGRFGELLAEREVRGLDLGSDNGLTAQQHTELMRKAGFGAVGCVWRYGHSCVLTAVRTRGTP